MRAELGISRLLSVALLLISLALAGSAAQAGTYTENFDGPLNPVLWTSYTGGHGENVTVSGGELVITIPGHAGGGDYYAGIESTFDLGSIFALQEGYALTTWPDGQSLNAGFTVYDQGDTQFIAATRQQRYDNYSSGGFWHNVYFGNIIGFLGFPDTSDTTGEILVTRNDGVNVNCQYWNGSAWTSFDSHSGNNSGGPFGLSVWSDGTQDVEVHFDYLTVTSDNVPVPLPPTALLLASGLLGLGGLRRIFKA